MAPEMVRELLHYDPETGVFRWRKKHARCIRAGDIAGCLDRFGAGYWRIRIDGKGYSGHRLAWLYVHGKWPEQVIDHINGDRADNRIANLREATHRQNQQNRTRVQRNNTSGVRGVTWDKVTKRWRAYIENMGHTICLGRYDDKERAAKARRDAELRLFSHSSFAMEQ